ncbi:hypothetical protein [Paenibacillus sp. LjRoot56]|uniref:hypothetical protein n=1 Tax=Paenibacillus sp. LjRoot56 TaxID=3342333 RepID=UPI003ECC2640
MGIKQGRVVAVTMFFIVTVRRVSESGPMCSCNDVFHRYIAGSERKWSNVAAVTMFFIVTVRVARESGSMSLL